MQVVEYCCLIIIDSELLGCLLYQRDLRLDVSIAADQLVVQQSTLLCYSAVSLKVLLLFALPCSLLKVLDSVQMP